MHWERKERWISECISWGTTNESDTNSTARRRRGRKRRWSGRRMWKRRPSPSLQTTATPISPAASIRNWHVPPICGHNLPPLPPQVVLPLWLLFVKHFYVHEVVKFSAWSCIFLCCAWSCIFFASFFSAGNASWQARQSRQPDWFAKIEASPSAAINPRHFFWVGNCIDGSHICCLSVLDIASWSVRIFYI